LWLRGVLALLCSTCTLILSSLEHRCVGCSDCGGVLAFLLSSLEHRCAGSSDCGGVLEYIEPLYRGPSRGPCIETIYPTLLGFGGIHHIILSYSFLELTTNIEFHVESSIEPELLLMFGPVVSLLSTIFQKVSTFYRAAF